MTRARKAKLKNAREAGAFMIMRRVEARDVRRFTSSADRAVSLAWCRGVLEEAACTFGQVVNGSDAQQYPELEEWALAVVRGALRGQRVPIMPDGSPLAEDVTEWVAAFLQEAFDTWGWRVPRAGSSRGAERPS